VARKFRGVQRSDDMMKKVVGTFERVSDASDAVRAIRTAGFLASDVELVVRSVDVGVADGDPASTAAGAARRIVAAGLAFRVSKPC
jgi:hypothetical protein